MGAVTESNWNEWNFNISSYADNNNNFKIRFGIGPTDGSVQYNGWNIDDITITSFFIDTINYSCMEYITDSFTVLNQTKIPKIRNSEEIVIYPNPAKNSFKINSNMKIESIKIYNSLGV